MSSKSVLDTISSIVAEHLYPATVLHVDVQDDTDHDGDPILRVEIVVEVEHGSLDPEKVLSLPRHLREPLAEVHENKFPMISFLSKDEFEGEAA